MNFGERLRLLRQERNLTQPELAESLGIEQSYLSKLENGKSLPSNDVLNSILEFFALEIGAVVDDLDQGARNKLRQIPAVADHFKHQRTLIIGNRRRWLFSSAVLVALGSSFIYSGTVNILGGDYLFSYESPGIVLDGEPKELFSRCFEGNRHRDCTDELRSRIDRVRIPTKPATDSGRSRPVIPKHAGPV